MSALLFPLPERPADVVRAALADHLERADSYPLPLPCPRMQDRLNERHAKQERRRYLAEPEPVTNFGDL